MRCVLFAKSILVSQTSSENKASAICTWLKRAWSQRDDRIRNATKTSIIVLFAILTQASIWRDVKQSKSKMNSPIEMGSTSRYILRAWFLFMRIPAHRSWWNPGKRTTQRNGIDAYSRWGCFFQSPRLKEGWKKSYSSNPSIVAQGMLISDCGTPHRLRLRHFLPFKCHARRIIVKCLVGRLEYIAVKIFPALDQCKNL